MTDVTTILQEVCNRIEKTIGIKPYLLEEIPTHFKEGEIYVLNPEYINSDFCIGSWSMAYFSVKVFMVVRAGTNSDRIATQDGVVLRSLKQAYTLMKTCFNRSGATYTDAVIYKISYTNDIIMTNGTPYVTCTSTLTFKSMMNFD